MRTIVSIGLLIVIGAVATFADLFVLNIAGMPGALIAGKPQKGFTGRYVLGLIISILGQSYVNLAYTAFVVNWTMLLISHQGIGPIIVWPVAFLAVAFPIAWNSFGALREAEKDGYLYVPNHVPLNAISWTTFITLIGFFIFAIFPNVMHLIYFWVPYVGS